MTRAGNIILFALTTGLILASSCSGVPRRVIQPDKMAALMADIHLGEAVAEQNRQSFNNDSTRQLLKQSIYAAHGVTPEEVDSSMMWYGRNIEKYVEVYEKTEKILEKELARANELAATATERPPLVAFEAEGDSVDIWSQFRMRPVSGNLASDSVTFEIRSDRYWELGDVYHLRFKGVNTPGKFEVSLAAEYPGGNIDYSSSSMAGDGWHDLYLHLNDTLRGSMIYGDIAYADPYADKPSAGPQARIDSISLIRMRSSNGGKMPRFGQNQFKSK